MKPTSSPTTRSSCEEPDEPSRYELAWQLAHSGLEPDDAIDAVAYALGVPHGVASGLVWAEMARPVACRPRLHWEDGRPPAREGLWHPLDGRAGGDAAPDETAPGGAAPVDAED